MNEPIRQLTSVTTTQIVVAVIGDAEMAAVTDRRYSEIAEAAREDSRPTICPTGYPVDWDSVKASQARSDLIKASIIFFGLDSDCLSQWDMVDANDC